MIYWNKGVWQPFVKTVAISLKCPSVMAIEYHAVFSNVLAANHLCTYADQTELSEFVLPE